jgi:hypothetical protein
VGDVQCSSYAELPTGEMIDPESSRFRSDHGQAGSNPKVFADHSSRIVASAWLSERQMPTDGQGAQAGDHSSNKGCVAVWAIGSAQPRLASPTRANSRVFPALRDSPGDRKQHNASREKH